MFPKRLELVAIKSAQPHFVSNCSTVRDAWGNVLKWDLRAREERVGERGSEKE